MNEIMQSSQKYKPMVERRGHLAQKIVFVDGQPGCGKTLFSPIIAALDRVELLTYAYEIEYICSLYYLNKITPDAANTMVRMLTDLQLYNTMMSREINFRPSDLSSVFRDVTPLKYIRRLFQKGDEAVPSRVEKEKPILHLTTHNILSFSSPIFNGLKDRIVFIEVVRHPLYMIKQQALNMDRLICDVRDFTLYFNYNGRQLPYYAFGWEDLFVRSNSIEKAIFLMEKLTAMAKAAKANLLKELDAKILTIPFERFVLSPQSYMEQMADAVGTKITPLTYKVMKKQNVPRKRYAEGVGLKIYKRCGWEPPQAGSTEDKEFEKRRRFAEERASPQAMRVLDRICIEYENKYMDGLKRKGEHCV